MTKTQLRRLKKNMDFRNQNDVKTDIKNKEFDFMIDMCYLTKDLTTSEWDWSQVAELVK